MLCVGSIGMDRIINELFLNNKGTIFQRNYRKITILWSFSYNSFVKFNGKIFLKPQHDHVISIFML